jgi:transcriptional regulator with XRE-family HTH domain
MDRTELADFLRARREALQPEDVGLPRGGRRRTGGLRREEVAMLSDNSDDYYSRIEQVRGPVPSEQVLASIAHGLHLTLDERDHLFLLAGYARPRRTARSDHINAGLMRVFDRLHDIPAQSVNSAGETLRQTRLAVALLGDETAFTGLDRARAYRWFHHPDARLSTPPADHARHGRTLVAHLATAAAAGGPKSRAAEVVDALRSSSDEFVDIWEQHPVVGPYCEPKSMVHPELGAMELYGETLLDPQQSQALMIFTAEPGSNSHDKLALLAVVGSQRF